jgi:hypothetical protein
MQPVAANYIVMTVLDLTGLILSYSWLLIDFQSGQVDVETFRGIYEKLRGFSNIFDLLFFKSNDPVDYMLGLSGLLWLMTLAKDLLRLKGYKRTTEDKCFLAFSMAISGFEGKARKLVGEIEPSKNVEIKVLAEVQSLLNNYVESRKLTKRYIRQTGEFETDSDIASFTNFLLLTTELLYHSHNSTKLSACVKFLFDHRLSDAEVIFATENVGHQGAIKEVLAQDDFRHVLPLSYCYMTWIAEHPHKALKLFEDLTPKEVERESGLWICLKLLMLEAVAESDEELASRAATWIEVEAERLRSVIRQEHDFTTLAAICWVLMSAQKFFSSKGVTGLGLLGLIDETRERLIDSHLTRPFIKDIDAMRGRYPVRTDTA